MNRLKNGIPVGGNSMSTVIEVRCLDFVEGVMSCLMSGLLVSIGLVSSDGSTTKTSGASEKNELV